jgi:hypothetical protein
MKRSLHYVVLLLSALPIEILSVTPVHIGKLYDRDTSIYENFNYGYDYLPGPHGLETSTKVNDGGIFVSAYLRKNSNTFDLYSWGGKIGSSVVPFVSEATESQIGWISFSCYMLDEDDGWESMVGYRNEEKKEFFKIYDDNGTELMSDAGTPYYGNDFNCTYIIRRPELGSNLDIDVWRFRTNISINTPKSLSKTKAAQTSFMYIQGLSDGNYKVSLSPSSNNQVQFQMFDLMGRCIFSKQLENLKSPVTFTIPESNVPNSPFIAKVKDGNETLYKKQIPVR